MKLPQFWRRLIAAKFAKLVMKIWQRHRCPQDPRSARFVLLESSLWYCWWSLLLGWVLKPRRTWFCRKLTLLVEQPASKRVQLPLFCFCSLLLLLTAYKSQFMRLVRRSALVTKLSLWLTLTICFSSLTSHQYKVHHWKDSAWKAFPYLLVFVFPIPLWVLWVCGRNFGASFR